MLDLQRADESHCAIVSQIICQSFQKQVEILGISQSIYPNFVAFETIERVQKRMSRGDNVVIAYLNKEPVGTISYKFESLPHKGSIRRLAVLPQFRGRSFGRILMNYAEEKLKEGNVHSIELAIVAQFTKLQRFYEELSYFPGERRFYETVPFEVLFMNKKLIPSQTS